MLTKTEKLTLLAMMRDAEFKIRSLGRYMKLTGEKAKDMPLYVHGQEAIGAADMLKEWIENLK